MHRDKSYQLRDPSRYPRHSREAWEYRNGLIQRGSVLCGRCDGLRTVDGEVCGACEGTGVSRGNEREFTE